MILSQYPGQAFQLFAGIDAASGIGWRRKTQYPGAVGERLFQLGGCYLEVLIDASTDHDRMRSGQLYDFDIRHPIRRQDDGLIARIEESETSIGAGVFSSVGYHELRRRIITVVVLFE